MQTSNYFIYNGDKGVSIAGKSPDWYVGRVYKKLAPKYWFFNIFKKMMTAHGQLMQAAMLAPELEYVQQTAKEIKRAAENFYITNYNKEVLSTLNPRQVYEKLGEDAILLCWEPPGVFCHRRLVAQWFENELGILVPERSPFD